MEKLILISILLALNVGNHVCTSQMNLSLLLAMFPYSEKMANIQITEQLSKFLLKNLEPEVEKQRSLKIQQQKQQIDRERAENLVYKKYFGGRQQASSVLRDFFTMRYLRK